VTEVGKHFEEMMPTVVLREAPPQQIESAKRESHKTVLRGDTKL
jgi:hypothetical protein